MQVLPLSSTEQSEHDAVVLDLSCPELRGGAGRGQRPPRSRQYKIQSNCRGQYLNTNVQLQTGEVETRQTSTGEENNHVTILGSV